LLEILITLLLAAHLLCVNVAAAGPLVCIWLDWKEGRGDALAGRAASYLGQASLLTLILGGLLGLAIGGASWSDAYSDLWAGPMSHKALWGVGEYVFSVVLAGGYVLWRGAAPGRLRGLRCFVLLLNGTNLLYHFPFLFTVAHDVYLQGEVLKPLSASEFRGWMAHPDVLARVVHVVLASFAVTGVTLIGYGLRLQREKGGAADSERVSRWGGYLALIPSLLQVPVGLWLIAVLPPQWQSRALGGDLPAAVLLGVSVLLALYLLQELANVAFGEVIHRKQLVRVMVTMVAIVLLMTGVLRRMRPPQPESNVDLVVSTQKGTLIVTNLR
jgi:hypothetical protein